MPASLLAMLLLAACQSPPPPVVAFSPSVGPARGVDIPTDASDVLGELQGSRLDFVARYYRDPASRWPTLSPSEVQRLSALGMKIVPVWEWHSGDPTYFSYATGYNDALNVDRQAKSVGQPPGTAVYFAVDFNARGYELGQVDQYFRGIAAGLAAAGGGRPNYRVGVYGSGAVCAAVKGAGLAQYAWLTGATSWDGTVGYEAWNIKQAGKGGRFPNLSFNHDANEAKGDYGGFQLANYANTATPAGAIVAVAAAAPAAAAAFVNGAVTAAVQPVAVAAAPTPTAPPMPTAAPMVASAQPPPAAPPVATAAPVAMAPPASATAAEVAALAAAEPPAAPAALRRDAGPETPPSARLAEPPSRERSGPHAVKALVAPERKAYAIATNNRAVVHPLRNLGGSSHGEFHQPGHRVSAPRRSEDHGAHLQAGRAGSVSLLHRSSRRSVE